MPQTLSLRLSWRMTHREILYAAFCTHGSGVAPVAVLSVLTLFAADDAAGAMLFVISEHPLSAHVWRIP